MAQTVSVLPTVKDHVARMESVSVRPVRNVVSLKSDNFQSCSVHLWQYRMLHCLQLYVLWLAKYSVLYINLSLIWLVLFL